MPGDQTTEQESHATISLSRRDLDAARRLLGALLDDGRNAPRELLERPVESRVSDEDRAVLTARARDEFQNRRRRGDLFAPSMFGEAAWDMLLALYILDTSGQRQTMGGLMQYSGAPTTTAKRWLDFLVAHDLASREPHPTDQRTAFVSLTAKARERLDLYYSGAIATVVSTSAPL